MTSVSSGNFTRRSCAGHCLGTRSAAASNPNMLLQLATPARNPSTQPQHTALVGWRAGRLGRAATAVAAACTRTVSRKYDVSKPLYTLYFRSK